MSNAPSTTSSPGPDHEITTYLEVSSRLGRLASDRIDVKTSSPLVAQLNGLLTTPYTSFSCNRYISATITSAKLTVCGNPAGTFGSPDVDLFLEKSQPSPFGRGDLTVMDTSYRKGREVASADFEIEGEGGDKLTTAIGDTVSSSLFYGRSVDVQMYKVAIYQEGGHFDWHRDTTHGDEHHATALVALGTTWTGGNLLVRHNDREISLDLHAKSDSSDPLRPSDARAYQREIPATGTLLPHIVAFYTDVEHKVEPVVEGTRIVLQFDIFVAEDDDSDFESHPLEQLQGMSYRGRRDSDSDSDVISSKNIRLALSDTKELKGNAEAISRMIEIMRTMHVSGEVYEIALPLQHLYRKASIKPRFLKGIDVILYQKLEAAGFDVSLHPVVLCLTSYGWSAKETYISAYLFDSSYNDVETQTRMRTRNSNRREFHLPADAAILTISSQVYIEHTGNESQSGEHQYFGGAMFIRAKEKLTQSLPLALESETKKRKRQTATIPSVEPSEDSDDDDEDYEDEDGSDEESESDSEESEVEGGDEDEEKEKEKKKHKKNDETES